MAACQSAFIELLLFSFFKFFFANNFKLGRSIALVIFKYRMQKTCPVKSETTQG